MGKTVIQCTGHDGSLRDAHVATCITTIVICKHLLKRKFQKS